MRIFEIFLYGSSIARLNEVGSGTREIGLYNAMSENNQVTLVDYKGQSEVTTDIKFAVISKPDSLSNLKWSLDFGHVISREISAEVDVFRCKQTYGSWLGIILSRRLKKPLIIKMGYSYAQSKKHQTTLGKWIYPFLTLIEGLLLSHADVVEFGSEYLEKRFKRFVKNSIVIRNPVDMKFYHKNGRRNLKYVAVGRIIPSKGSVELVSFALNVEKGLIIGLNPDNHNFMNQIYISRVDNDDLPNLLQDCEYYVSFSKTEGSPKSLLEAIFSGCVPIVSDIDAHKDIIEDLGYGYLVSDFEKAVSLVNENSNNYSEELHERFVNKWNIERVLDMEQEIINAIN